MAVRYEDQCVGCPPEMGCLGSLCMYKKVPVFSCDKCGDELDAEDLYDVDGDMLCQHCLLDSYDKVNAEDY